MFRSSFDVDPRLTADDGTIVLEGQARVESVSIGEPPDFREHAAPTSSTQTRLMRLLAVSGSLRRRSHNSALLDAPAAICRTAEIGACPNPSSIAMGLFT